MTGAITFLQHIRDMCNKKKIDCFTNCIRKSKKDGMYGKCPILWFDKLTDKEIADLVREVERWWRENGE